MPINADAARIAEYIGTRLQALRKERGINQAELAPVYGVKHGQVSNYEKGASLITLDNLYRIAAYFNVPVESLLPPVEAARPARKGMAEDQAPFSHADAPSSSPSIVTEAETLAQTYLSISDPEVRASLLQHAATLAKLAR